MYCFLYYVHGTHNPTIFASSHVNQHLYEYDNVRCELFSTSGFPEPNEVRKTLQALFYLFWHNMYFFMTLYSFRNFLFVLTLYLFILTSCQVTWLNAIQTRTSFLDFRFRSGIQAPVHMWLAFFKRGFEFSHNLIHYSFCEPHRLLAVR